MSKSNLLGASALLLVFGIASASAEPYDPSSAYSGHTLRMSEGRAAAIEGRSPYQGPNGYVRSMGPSSVILQEFHEGGK